MPKPKENDPDAMFEKAPEHVRNLWKEAKKLKREKARKEFKDRKDFRERDSRAQFR